MMNKLYSLLTSVAALTLSLSVSAAAEAPTVSLEMADAHKLRDVQLSNMSLKRSAQVVKKELQELFAEEGSKALGPGHKISIKVLNVDLPGYIDFANRGANYIRVVRRNDVYRLEYEYKITGADGEVIASGKNKISGFYEPGGRIESRFMRGNTAYFNKPVQDWFNELAK